MLILNQEIIKIKIQIQSIVEMGIKTLENALNRRKKMIKNHRLLTI